MNLNENHSASKPVSTHLLFKGSESTTISLQILKGEQLKEHITKVPAFLLCVSGEVIFENEQGLETLQSGDYIHIEPMVKHWVDGVKDSQLVLMK